jgi:hypothetical protein
LCPPLCGNVMSQLSGGGWVCSFVVGVSLVLLAGCDGARACFVRKACGMRLTYLTHYIFVSAACLAMLVGLAKACTGDLS